ncbi:hypothetical protein DPMN_006505 [Dreissena polymorpha]|uniref:Uncharacterized protein n=1 Tax=Dreissena polymorpha TaxID=45954 RepID=A0A9D4MVK5_DREPO|nr:hypothetical protein DPMN_006505 [Dreissena polymorpha]
MISYTSMEKKANKSSCLAVRITFTTVNIFKAHSEIMGLKACMYSIIQEKPTQAAQAATVCQDWIFMKEQLPVDFAACTGRCRGSSHHI